MSQDQVSLGKDVVEGGKFLCFYLGDEEYAIEILKVQEIIGLMPITPVPRVPEYIRGVLNLRGKIVPIMDLRMRFNFQSIEDTEETCIIVLQDEDFQMGVVVDKVSEVADIDSSQIEEVPFVGVAGKKDFLLGIGKVKDSVSLIIDVHEVLFNLPEDVLEKIAQDFPSNRD